MDVYAQHRAAFASVSAWVILDRKRERVATIALKYPRDGAGRLYAYFHLHGVPMVRAFASGGGYDKASAAISAAIALVAPYGPEDVERFGPEHNARLAALRDAAKAMDSGSWERCIENAGKGFAVLQAV